MWETCGQLNMPGAVDVSDPIAFFTPTDRFNERYEELNNHPDWSFYDHNFPSNAELLEARNRVMGRHPRTQFLVLHVGNFSENLANVSENLDRFPNMTVDIAARIGELGRQPRTARKFFDKYQDRVLFGTDATPHGDEFPQQVFNDALYEIYYRFLETDDEYFLYICPYEELHLKPNPDTKHETNQLWNWDVAEVFLGTDFQNIRRYKEFEVSPQGEWIDLDVDLALPNHEVGWTWNSGFTVSAQIDRRAKVWYGAMRIPFSSLLSQTPTEGTVFRANLFR